MAFILPLRLCPYSVTFSRRLSKSRRNPRCFFFFSAALSSSLSTSPKNLSIESDAEMLFPSTSTRKDSPFSGLEDVMMGYIFGKKRATEVAHSVWRHVVQKGDAVVDATCGNGYDTLAMLKMVADKSLSGRVYAIDIQKVAIESTTTLLEGALNSKEKEVVELFNICHSKMEEVVSRDIAVRLVAFNLGYLPGSDKTVMTRSETTLLGLEAAERILAPGGLISIVVYVGHPGGMEEFEQVQAFGSGLAIDKWVGCKIQMLNRPFAPIIVFLFKRENSEKAY